jgi:trimeric autotransporter adhesin
MKRIYLLLVSVAMTVIANAQITIAGSTGTANGVYTSFTNAGGAFAALNTAGSHNPADVITISITADVLAELGTNSLNAGTWASITVTPTGARTISGTTGAVAPLVLIDFNGADNVTINGLNSGGNTLTIANLSTSAVSITSTIRFIGGATNNTITNCSIQGSGTMSVATNGAVIFFSTDAVTASGNDNNTISNNDIGPAGANLPTKGILGNGSTTTTAIGNSGIVINNNDIHDYFGAAVTSAGIATNGGCNTWTITNNRFYQTGTRTFTAGVLHNAMLIGNTTATSGAQGFTITGNIVGYASNTQTGTYTLTGAVTATFRGIVFNGTTLGTVSNINSNTVASISLTGVTSSGTSSSSPFMGIYVTNGVANTNSNTIGSQSATGSLVYSTTSASAADMIGMFNFSVDTWTANTNNIGGLTSSNAGAGAANAYGIRLNTSSAVTTTLNGNIVGGTVANSIQSTSTATGAQVAGIFVSTSIATVSNNTVRNLTNAGGTGTTTAASVVGIDFISATPVNTASQNTIFNLTSTNAAAATVVTGIQFTGAVGNVVERNLIHSLTSSTTSITAEINGIRVGGGTTTYRNNMIALGAGVTNAIGSAASNSGTSGINGINEFLGTDNFYHNSVYIGGSPTAGLGASYAFNGTQTVNTRSFRDNIFFNARSNSGATGTNYAVKINGTIPNPTGLTINNNVYFANGTGAMFGFFNSLDVANLTAWKTAVGQDAGSFEGNPQYNDPTNATPDLHIHPTNVTVIEGNGVDVGVTNDYDGQTRASFTPVDIGADAGNFVGADLSAPAISAITLGGTNCDLISRNVTATLIDITGVDNTAGLRPRIYFRKNAGAYFSAQGSLTSGTVNSGSWTFTINYATVGGVVVTDVISYFIVAQDVSAPPNVGGSPSGGLVLTDVNTITTPPTTPLTYTIQNTLAAGTYLVGTGQVAPNYATLTAAVADYNNSCLGGAIVFELQDVSYTTAPTGAGEVYPITINANPYASATNTLTIKPKSGVAVTMTGSLNGALIVLNDADYVTIDGSSTGASAAACLVGGDAAIRELTIQNTNVGTSAVVISVGSGINGAQNNTIKNVNILGQDPLTTLLGISLGGTTPGTAGTDNDNNRVENCSVKRAIFGIYSAGASAANQNTGTVITKNDLSALTTDRIRRVGIMVFNDNGAQVIYNSVAVETNESADAIGIAMGNQGIDATVTTSGAITNALVANNKINGIASLSAVGFSAAGITIA